MTTTATATSRHRLGAPSAAPRRSGLFSCAQRLSEYAADPIPMMKAHHPSNITAAYGGPSGHGPVA